MSLNDVKLSSQQLAQLYANVLIETDATPVPDKVAPLIHALGGNAKNILIVISKNDTAFLPENEMVFLTNVLAACNLSLVDVALINRAQLQEQSYQSLISYFQSTHILLFDIEPLTFGLPINFPPFQVQLFNKCTYLHAPDLKKIEKDVSLKKDLWNALKTFFGL